MFSIYLFIYMYPVNRRFNVGNMDSNDDGGIPIALDTHNMTWEDNYYSDLSRYGMSSITYVLLDSFLSLARSRIS